MYLFLRILSNFVDVLLFFAAAGFIGLWWVPEMFSGIEGGANASLMRATGGLVIGAVVFYQLIYKTRKGRSNFRFYFYFTLATVAIFGYLYGIFSLGFPK